MSFWSRLTSAFSRKDNREEVIGELLNRIGQMQRQQHGTYDAARTPDDLAKYWANADSFDANSANSRDVRHTLSIRSRYEASNNGYYDGIAQTYCDDLVGLGPSLRMQTNSTGFNRVVELQFNLWWQAVGMRRKLWCQTHAKHIDGEGIGVLRRNPKVKHDIPLDYVLYEAEQMQTPMLMPTAGYIDGIKYDEFGNVEHYDLLHQHPGAGLQVDFNPERIAPEFVCHWFKMRRPGQQRGVVECASTLNMGACFRRGREATLATWEKVAAFTLLLKTLFEPEEIQALPPMATLDVLYGMITALPNSVEPYQLKAEHPGPTYESFHALLLNEMARPKSMPRNKAGCDSSNYNYASGRLDHQTYYKSLDGDRADCNELVLDKIFRVWFDLAIRAFGWLGGNPELVTEGARVHAWDWPQYGVADVESEANANDTNLRNGSIFLPQLYSKKGEDFDDECEKVAQAFGVDVAQVKERLFDLLYPPSQAPSPPSASVDPGAGKSLEEQLNELFSVGAD